MLSITVDGLVQEAKADERLIDVINRSSRKVPQVRYHPQLGPIQTCDTCMVREKTPDTFVEVSPDLGRERGIQIGTWVHLTSRYGRVRVRAVVTDRVHGKQLYMPMNSVGNPINLLSSSHTDPVTHTPAFKEISVHMTVLPEIGVSPLPRTNSRWGHPTPQRGVKVERKWQRADYRPPGPQLVQTQPRQVG
ncbi:MAG TPA: molybdopterin dinucleotide binding domain-containing protein [Pyrinomonadaceae bacterium]|nr:molybdopterin dinucleotide binding domain-containing protein [Pyrinomonadaceae bacterium]